MLSFLKNHPFAVEAFLERSLVLTYAVPKDELKGMIPECLALDTFDDQWAFISVTVSQARNMHPTGLPGFTGNDPITIAYRIYVRYITRQGKRLRGYFVLGSEATKSRVSFFGNIFTRYKYKTTDVKMSVKGSAISVQSARSALDISVKMSAQSSALPPKSPFKDWKEAANYAGMLPYTFTYLEKTREVLIVEGSKEHWVPTPAEIMKSNADFIASLPMKGLVPASAFIVEDISYLWEKGRLERWK